MIYIDDKTKKQIFLVSGVLCLAAVCAVAALSGAGKDRTETGRIAAETVPDEYFAEPEPEVWVVYVTGEVILPGVYELSPGSRVNDAVRSAGGFTPRADRNSVNLAAKLRDEAHIAVPAVTPPAPDVSPPPQLAQNAAGAPWRSPDPSGASGAGAVSYPRREPRADDKNKIDINRADASQLNTLPGIGPKLSAAIVGYREANGPFESVDDLRNVRGIGEKRLEAIRELVTAGI